MVSEAPAFPAPVVDVSDEETLDGHPTVGMISHGAGHVGPQPFEATDDVTLSILRKEADYELARIYVFFENPDKALKGYKSGGLKKLVSKLQQARHDGGLATLRKLIYSAQAVGQPRL